MNTINFHSKILYNKSLIPPFSSTAKNFRIENHSFKNHQLFVKQLNKHPKLLLNKYVNY